MRNLKRALSLAVSTVMLVGMMAVGTSAASYADVTSEHNEEAIEVMQAVSVMVGDENGNFNPDKNVTRAEMAVVMANLLDLQVEDFVGASIPFTDVPEWARAYVAACYADGITGGISATQYGSNNSVTATQAALMLLKALGYFQYSSDFGTDWQVATIKQASNVGLFEGIDSARNAAMTRNEVAQLALNALEATMVEPDGSSTDITLPGDIVISTGGTKYVDVTSKADYANAFGDKEVDNDKYVVQLGEKLFNGDLTKKTSGRDDLGRPGVEWTYDKKSVGTYGDKADYVVTLDDDYSADAADAQDFLKVLQDLTGNDDLKLYTVGNVDDVTLYVNGEDKSGKDYGDNAVSGTVIELFCDGDDITDAVALDYALAEIEDVSTSLTKAQKEDGATCKIKLNSKFYLDSDIEGFDADTYEEGAYILYVAKGDEILASQVAESVEGRVTATKGDDVRIDGTYYTNATGSDISVGDEGVFYLNMAGQIEAVDTSSTASDNYAYIYSIDEDSGKNSDGIDATTYTAYVVLADGTKASYEFDVDNVTQKESDGLEREIGVYFADSTKKVFTGSDDSKVFFEGVIAYSVNSDDELVYEDAKDNIEPESSLTINEDKANGTSSSTEFIFAYRDGSKVKVSLATGYKNVDISSVEKAWTVTNDDHDILYVFVAAKNGSVTTDANLAVILDASAVVEENDDGDKVYTYAAVVDGEETELTFKKSQSFKDGQVIAYEMDGDYAAIDSDAEVEDGTTTAANDDYFTVGGTQYNLGGDETVYTITMEYENEDAYDDGNGDPDSVTVSEGGKIEKGDKVVFTLYKDELDIVFVYEYVY